MLLAVICSASSMRTWTKWILGRKLRIKNRCLRRTGERYLRDDLACGFHRCGPCRSLANNNRDKKSNSSKILLVPGNHAAIIGA
uniref:Secreted protein n=1 Tax=Angiostrongylus cantonensis TaxID=6313 RepID=A0A0K0DEL7_ANGCA